MFKNISLTAVICCSILIVSGGGLAAGQGLSTRISNEPLVNPEINGILSRTDLTTEESALWGFLRDSCYDSSIWTMHGMPKDHSSKIRGTFDYKFQWKRKTQYIGTIIYLTGGPGGWGSVSNHPEIDPRYDNLIIDPRGLGCNYKNETSLPNDLITTEQTAEDILALIRELKLTNYVIYGHSYGTALATVLSSKIASHSDIQPPTAVVLIGTVGQQFGITYESNWQDLWDDIIVRNPDIKILFQNSAHLPLGQNTDVWGKFIDENLRDDALALEIYLRNLANKVNGRLSHSNANSVDSFFNLAFKNLTSISYSTALRFGGFGGAYRVQRNILCSELASQRFLENSFKIGLNGQLEIFDPTGGSKDLCDQMSLSNPFDAKNYQIKAPIYYFQGTHDPQTPMSSAEYHQMSQITTLKKFFTRISGAGHSPQLNSSQILSCMPELWNKIFATQPVEDALGDDGRCRRASRPHEFPIIPK